MGILSHTMNFSNTELETYIDTTFPCAVSHHLAGTAYQEARRLNLRYESVNERMEGVCKTYENI